MLRWIALLACVAALAACANTPSDPSAPRAWNGGIWNSTLGYIGPANTVVVGGPSGS